MFALTLAATLLAAAALAGLGGAAQRWRGERWADPALGWGVLALALLLGSVLGLGLRWVAVPLLLGGLAVFARHWRTRWRALLPGLLALPLLAVAAAMPEVAWDDYSHWLPNAQYLLAQDSFPALGLPAPSSHHAGYPPGVALLTLLASLPLRALGAAPIAETAGAVFTLLLLACLGAGISRARWGFPLALLGLYWLNPGFVPRIVFTNYGEMPSAVLLATAALLLARGALPQAALALVALVLVKQTGLVLALLLLLGAGLLAITERRRDWRLALVAVPMLLAWALWQPHAQAAGGVFGFKPLAEWAWALAPRTLAAIGRVMVQKLAFTLALLAALGWAVRGARGEARRLAVLAAPVLAGWPSFLFVTYMGGSFAESEVAQAASFWRYGTQLDALIMAVLLLALLALPRLPAAVALVAARWWARPALLALLLVLPLAAQPYLWPNRREQAPPLRAALAVLAPQVPPGAVLAVVDPRGTGYAWLVTHYVLAERARVTAPARTFGVAPLDAATLRARLAEDGADQVLLLSSDAGAEAALATPPLPPGGWRLLRRAGEAWAVVSEGRVGQGS